MEDKDAPKEMVTLSIHSSNDAKTITVDALASTVDSQAAISNTVVSRMALTNTIDSQPSIVGNNVHEGNCIATGNRGKTGDNDSIGLGRESDHDCRSGVFVLSYDETSPSMKKIKQVIFAKTTHDVTTRLQL
jgi:hypothetical protein